MGGRRRGPRGSGPGTDPGNTREEREIPEIRNGRRGVMGRNCWKNG